MLFGVKRKLDNLTISGWEKPVAGGTLIVIGKVGASFSLFLITSSLISFWPAGSINCLPFGICGLAGGGLLQIAGGTCLFLSIKKKPLPSDSSTPEVQKPFVYYPRRKSPPKQEPSEDIAANTELTALRNLLEGEEVEVDITNITMDTTRNEGNTTRRDEPTGSLASLDLELENGDNVHVPHKPKSPPPPRSVSSDRTASPWGDVIRILDDSTQRNISLEEAQIEGSVDMPYALKEDKRVSLSPEPKVEVRVIFPSEESLEEDQSLALEEGTEDDGAELVPET